MNENNITVFADGTFLREKTFNDGGSVINLSISVDKFTEFLKKYKKEDGFVRLVISKKRNPDEKSSHFMKLDTFVPQAKNGGVIAPKPQPKPVIKKAAPAPQPEDDETNLF